MNLKEARRLQPGAIVRESWGPHSVEGLVLSKEHVKENHVAKTLCQEKTERYDFVIHWFGKPPQQWVNSQSNRSVVQIRQNWEVMVKSHAS